MRKIILLLTALTLSVSSFAQEPYDLQMADSIVKADGKYLIENRDDGYFVFDINARSYIPRKEFIDIYGKKTLAKVEDANKERIKAEDIARRNNEIEETKKQAINDLLAIDSYESIDYSENKYSNILDAIDGYQDGIIDYLGAAIFFKDNITGIDENGNISIVNIIQCPGMSKDQIYIQANSWFVNTFNSGKSVIQLNDKEMGVILAKGYLPNIAQQVGFAISYEVSADVIFRIDIKDGRTRLIMTIQNYDSINRGGVAGALSGNISQSKASFKPSDVYPFVDKNTGVSKKAGAKAYCACCMYMIAMKNQLQKAINSGIIGVDADDNW